MGGTGECKPSLPAGEAKAAPVDRALHALGFEFTLITPREVVGRLPVTETCCQPFNWLNGGVSALMAETTASIGGYVASGYRRLAGVQLSINHVGPARLGDVVQAQATPIQLGRKIQVWEVQIWRIDPSTSECKDLVSTARVTLLTNLSTPEEMKSYEVGLKKLAKL
ncbi:1,4-dihydroxy-2-naphthoyl-CoA thioesterase 1-like [Phragmites australis]|uniref:1,4-dihydroxy-2-naphthoyl-CoA thioesterase 1-like n=1 Tax=Phragmites australis TaxID=29695 RepID=UPI002D773855|nr:1,4-dihydroxy-2-naphthoyl-CoA thioesterase 1-like [Phragmites australis]